MISAEHAREKLAAHIAEQDAKRGRSLTETEKVRNLFRAIYADEIDVIRAETLQRVLKIIDEEGSIDTKRGWARVRERIYRLAQS
jgi:hypothetical protein